jgi:hypothetical protein
MTVLPDFARTVALAAASVKVGSKMSRLALVDAPMAA